MQKGFTLMEVLVATAICGIALGVALSGLSQGHRATQRAILMEQAGQALRLVKMRISSEEFQGLLADQGMIEDEIDGLDGWSFKISTEDLVIRLKRVSNATDEKAEEEDAPEPITMDDMKEISIQLTDPQGRTFHVVWWR